MFPHSLCFLILGFSSGRPRRACTSLVQSYHETSLQNKLRRDAQSERGAKKRTRQETPAVEKKRVGKITTRIKNQRVRKERGEERREVLVH